MQQYGDSCSACDKNDTNMYYKISNPTIKSKVSREVGECINHNNYYVTLVILYNGMIYMHVYGGVMMHVLYIILNSSHLWSNHMPIINILLLKGFLMVPLC